MYLQKAFDIVIQKILLLEKEYCGMGSIYNDWFKFYLAERIHFVSVIGFNSDIEPVNV